MSFRPDSLSAFGAAPFDSVIDVRSPAEFAEDHVPGAVSLPVLDDAERARVGTIYVRQSAFRARKIGAALVARNAARHVEGPLADHDGGWRPLVYCWRGGQRSNAFAAILGQIGWRVAVLDGGYRTYRGLVKTALYDRAFPARVVLLDGFTGTAKTEILHRAARAGAQVIDLEGLANHRGSLFGAMGRQPAQKGFESALAEAMRALDPARPVLVEAESSKVGERVLPPGLWKAMQAAPRITVEAPLEVRAAYLARTYDDLCADPGRLDGILVSLIRLQGRERVAHWRDLAREGRNADLAAELMAHHYDPRYARQLDRGGGGTLGTVTARRLDDTELDALGTRVAEMADMAGAQG
ncbi:tRNA 2-selenouridine(34) synthase MnmH [Palleronia rufa]|uniref:tRNA 2-selenouridine(34) synthase MnmH n=1 Tax=Palleronia rufa TaxID=1530186 RepID=UPI0005651EFD|nr:tRNA 2-selenouridine(34) synthase MnmH [Palleronia rufa]